MGDTKIQGIGSSEPLGGKENSKSSDFYPPFPLGFPSNQAAQAQYKTLLPALLRMNYFLSLCSLLSLG